MQPVEVDAWQWRQMMLSEHGPPKENARLVALAVARDVGVSQRDAWPAQKTIARNAQVGLRTAQRLLTELAEQGWCVRGRGPTTGKGWALTAYTFTVPAHLEEFIPAHPWEDDPTWERGVKDVASPAKKRNAKAVASRSAQDTDGAANSQAMVPPTGDMVPPKTPMVPPTEWRTTNPLTNPLTNPREDGALPRPGVALKSVREEIRRGLQGKRTIPTPDVIARLRKMDITTAYEISRQLHIGLHEAEEALKKATQSDAGRHRGAG